MAFFSLLAENEGREREVMGRPYISVAKKGDGADFKGAAKGCEKNRKNR